MPTDFFVHPSAVVDARVKIGPGASIGPGCVVQGDVTLGANVKLIANCHVQGPGSIGDDTVVYPFACIGFEPQDYKFAPGTPTAGFQIGKKNIIREGVSIHQASKTTHPTTVGDGCMLMVNSHMGHDAVIGNNVILVNGALLAGHSTLANNVTISGNAAVHQFVKIGRFSFVTGVIGITNDMPPFCVAGSRNRATGINVVGMRRAGISRDEISSVRKAFRLIFNRPLTRPDMLEVLAPLAATSSCVKEIHDFIAFDSKRTIIKGSMNLDEGDHDA
jgi:UDP-N-acetylglucosamine acyltransferase